MIAVVELHEVSILSCLQPVKVFLNTSLMLWGVNLPPSQVSSADLSTVNTILLSRLLMEVLVLASVLTPKERH